MLLVLSPSKTLDFTTMPHTLLHTQPQFQKDIQALVTMMQKYTVPKLMKLMDVSEKIAQLNVDRYAQFAHEFTQDNAKPALLAFKGDVYEGMAVAEYQEKDFAFAQDHLRILSGLYGLLRPLDLMQPYRLEMGTKLPKSLYTHWGDRISKALNDAMQEGDVLVNLASQEYFKAVQPKALNSKVLTIHFKEYKNGDYKVIGLFAKRARGLMADFVIRNHITKPEQMKEFAVEGYMFNAKLSSQDEWVFGRKV